MSKKLKEKIENRKQHIEVEVPKTPKKLGTLLRNMEETDRILRQEPDFLVKIRDYKPEIKLSYTVRKKRAESETPNIKKKGKKNIGVFPKEPCRIPSSGIFIGDSH